MRAGEREVDGLLGCANECCELVRVQFTQERDSVYPGVQGAYYWTEVLAPLRLLSDFLICTAGLLASVAVVVMCR